MNILLKRYDFVQVKMKGKAVDNNQKEEDNALQMLKKPVHWGIADSSENIDRYLYGENQ